MCVDCNCNGDAIGARGSRDNCVRRRPLHGRFLTPWCATATWTTATTTKTSRMTAAASSRAIGQGCGHTGCVVVTFVCHSCVPHAGCGFATSGASPDASETCSRASFADPRGQSMGASRYRSEHIHERAHGEPRGSLLPRQIERQSFGRLEGGPSSLPHAGALDALSHHLGDVHRALPSSAEPTSNRHSAPMGRHFRGHSSGVAAVDARARAKGAW